MKTKRVKLAVGVLLLAVFAFAAGAAFFEKSRQLFAQCFGLLRG